jgi:glyoxylate/hydroxypyruvate reductase
MNGILVAVTGWEVEQWRDRFRALMPERPVALIGTPEAAAVERFGYAVTWKHPEGSLNAYPNLKAIFSLGAGVDHLMRDAALPDLPVVRVVDPDLTNRMSEYAVLHALLHLRQMPRYASQQRTKSWDDDRLQPAAGEVRVGVMGLGVLGEDAARKLQVMGFDVAGWSRRAKHVEGIATFSGTDGLDAFLARTDILVVLLPLTEGTRGIVDRTLIAKLARGGRLRGPILINAGRGGLQKEADILACLDDGTLKAASLDVFETEPLDPASRLWDHPAVVVTPHNAAMSAPEAVGAQIAQQIRQFEGGLALANTVDRAVGY